MRHRSLSVLIFLVILGGSFYFANFAIYEALVSMFTIENTSCLIILGVALGLLSSSFIIASLVGMRYYNVFTRWFYTASAVWLGFSIYLFFASVIYVAATAISDSQAPLLGMISIAGAVAVSIYGISRAEKITIKNISVTLPNLPAGWKGKKAIWMSDLHLGQLHGPSFAKKVMDKVRQTPHDIIFIGGDLFDGTGAPDIQELILPLKDLSGAPMGAYFITGNHEEYGPTQRFLAAVQSLGIKVLFDEMVNIEGMQLIGVDYNSAATKAGFHKVLSGLSPDRNIPSILLKHEPKDLPVAHKAGISMQISGHTHQAQMWPLNYVAGLVYKGFSYGLKDLYDMKVYVSSGTGTWGPPMRIISSCEIVVITFA